MAWQAETSSLGTRASSRSDLLNRLVSFLTSQHVATVAVDTAGTGYVAGEVLTLTHAGAHLDARFEITSVGGSGEVTGLRIVSSGAFANRLSGTVTINAGGTGYEASASNLVLEIQGGSSRCPAKLLATTDGSGVVTSAVVFEDLGTGGIGAYSSAPSFPAATAIVGPDGTAAGSGCTVTLGSTTGLVGTSGLSVTGGSGSGATVDITLAQTGWSVDERNTNDRAQNGEDDEKEVVLVGDASGWTNKPFVALYTGSAASGLNTRHAIAIQGLVAHNPALPMTSQTGRSNGPDATTMPAGGSYLILPEDSGGGVDEVEFWISANDTRFFVLAQILESAGPSDDAVYVHAHGGYLERFGTETEVPYPMLVGASSRQIGVDPTAANASVSSIAELRYPSGSAFYAYDSSAGAWVALINQDSDSASGTVSDAMVFPVGQNRVNGTGADQVAEEGSLNIYENVFERDRGSATRVFRNIPGTADLPFLWPLVPIQKPDDQVDLVSDRFFGQVDGVYWISSDNGSGARIANFSEDYVTQGGNRYRVFHNHVHTEPYQYIAVLEDV